MSYDLANHKWRYPSDLLYIGNKKIDEIWVGTKKIYPDTLDLKYLRDIVEDDAREYGDAGGVKYNWYVWFANEGAYENFGNRDPDVDTVTAYIFCDWHAPNNGQYYEKDLSKPVGYTNWGDVYRTTIDGVQIEKPRMRIIYYYAQSSAQIPIYRDGGMWGNAYTIPVTPYWHQGDAEGKYHTPGDNIIWSGWGWWIYQDDRYIFKYDFKKREFGPELTGADLWYPPE